MNIHFIHVGVWIWVKVDYQLREWIEYKMYKLNVPNYLGIIHTAACVKSPLFFVAE
jgi:hypothetical protein